MPACTKSGDPKFTYNTNFGTQSMIRVFVATVNANRNYVYVNGSPLNGASLVSGSIFPASNIYGSAISSGVSAFLVRDTLRTSTQTQLAFSENLAGGKDYTIFLYDTITSPKQKTVLTNYIVPSDTSARIRFANFIYNPTAVPTVDVFSLNKNANIFSGVAVTDVTEFINYPSRLETDTLYIRETGTLTNIVKIPTSGLTDKRSYTIVYRGSYRGTRLATIYLDR